MKRWVSIAARLYPSAWRARYGREFDALLADVEPGWRELFDVLGGAIKIQITSAALYWKLGLAFGLMGSLLTVAGPLAARKQYASTALLRYSADGSSSINLGQIAAVEEEVLSRSSLSGLIQRPELNLYQSERMRQPLEDVINRMRDRDLSVHMVSSDKRSAVLSISFSYPDEGRAQAVASEVVHRFNNAFLRQREVNSHMPGATPILENLDVVNAPTHPVAAEEHWIRPLLTGLLTGLAVGVFMAFFVRQPKRALVVSSVGLAGCIAGFGCSFLMTPQYVSTAVLRIIPFDRLSGIAEGRQWLERLAQQVAGKELLEYRFTGDGTALELRFANRDPSRAQGTLVDVCRKIIETGRAEIQGTKRPSSVLNSGIVEYVDQASFPVTPIFPNRLVVGLMVGLGMALAAGFRSGSATRRATSETSAHGLAFD